MVTMSLRLHRVYHDLMCFRKAATALNSACVEGLTSIAAGATAFTIEQNNQFVKYCVGHSQVRNQRRRLESGDPAPAATQAPVQADSVTAGPRPETHGPPLDPP